MSHSPSLFSRRNFLGAAAGVIATSKLLHAQGPVVPPAPAQSPLRRHSTVSLASGNSRRENICQSLVAIQTHVDIMLTAQRLQPCWGAAVIDGYEGMEGDGPNNGTLVPSRIAIASTDYVAADRVGIEAMGLDPAWVGYLGFCAPCGLGQDDLSKIDIRGAKLADVAKKYRLHADIERELKWMGPMKEVPEKLG